jgi:hypothetical protein
MPQTSVATPAIGYAGQVADAAPLYCRTGIAEGTVTPGQVVLRGTDPANQVKAITDGATVDASTVAGFCVLDTALEDNPYVDESVVRVMRVGVIYVTVTAAVVAGNPVYVGNATAQLGNIDDATGVGLALLPGARFLTSASANGIAAVQVSMI